jgi:hypothetical protein
MQADITMRRASGRDWTVDCCAHNGGSKERGQQEMNDWLEGQRNGIGKRGNAMVKRAWCRWWTEGDRRNRKRRKMLDFGDLSYSCMRRTTLAVRFLGSGSTRACGGGFSTGRDAGGVNIPVLLTAIYNKQFDRSPSASKFSCLSLNLALPFLPPC